VAAADQSNREMEQLTREHFPVDAKRTDAAGYPSGERRHLYSGAVNRLAFSFSNSSIDLVSSATRFLERFL
jgi:hypothetical protein